MSPRNSVPGLAPTDSTTNVVHVHRFIRCGKRQLSGDCKAAIYTFVQRPQGNALKAPQPVWTEIPKPFSNSGKPEALAKDAQAGIQITTWPWSWGRWRLHRLTYGHWLCGFIHNLSSTTIFFAAVHGTVSNEG